MGIRDQELSKKLQLDPDLTLEKTKNTIRQKEAVKEQQYILQGNDTKEPSLEEVRYGKWHRKPPRPEVRPQYMQRDTNSKCMNRADNSLCTRGHYSAQCFSRKASASASQVSLDCAFLDTVGNSSTSCWITQVLL